MKSQQRTGYQMIFMAGALWGTIGFFVNVLGEMGVKAEVIPLLRIGMGAILLVPITLASGGIGALKIDRRGLRYCIVLGAFCQALFNLSYTESIKYIGVSTAVVLLYTAPIFVCIMSRIFFKEEIGPQKLLALAVNIIGCVLTVTDGNFTTIHFSMFGVAAGVTAGFLYGLMTIISKGATAEYDPMTISFYSFIFGSLCLTLATRPWINLGNVFSWELLLVALGYGMIPTVGSYVLYLKGLSRDLETSRVPIIASVETIVAAVIGIAVFGESHGFIKVMGICMVVLSIVIMNMNFRKETK
jgi:drug/metabolite transporter (DMT)-like permease